MPEVPPPSLDEIQQVDERPTLALPAVPVEVTGPVNTHELPSRLGVVFDLPLTTAWQMVLGEDLKRKRLVIVCDADWQVSHAGRGGGRWPANVPLVITHASPVYALKGTNPGTVTVIPEEWAD